MQSRKDDLQAAEQRRQDALQTLQASLVGRRAKLANIHNTVVWEKGASIETLQKEVEEDREGRLFSKWPTLVAHKAQSLQAETQKIQQSAMAYQRTITDYHKQFGLDAAEETNDENVETNVQQDVDMTLANEQ